MPNPERTYHGTMHINPKGPDMNDAILATPMPPSDADKLTHYEAADLMLAGEILTDASFGVSKAAGWHNDLHTGAPRTPEQNHALFFTRIALCHSELSEALEGHCKGLMDDKLPHRTMAEVELADTVIRVFDLAGAMGYDIAGAIVEKLEYNARHTDHKPEARLALGGKAY